MTFEQLSAANVPTFFTNWNDTTNFPKCYGSGIVIPGLDSKVKNLIYLCGNKMYTRCLGSDGWNDWVEII